MNHNHAVSGQLGKRRQSVGTSSAAKSPPTDPASVVTRLRRLFWDHPLTEADLMAHPVWLIERVLDYGNLDDVYMLQNVLGRANFLRIAAQAVRVSPRTRSFWRQLLEMEGIPCTREFSRDTPWNC